MSVNTLPAVSGYLDLTAKNAPQRSLSLFLPLSFSLLFSLSLSHVLLKHTFILWSAVVIIPIFWYSAPSNLRIILTSHELLLKEGKMTIQWSLPTMRSQSLKFFKRIRKLKLITLHERCVHHLFGNICTMNSDDNLFPFNTNLLSKFQPNRLSGVAAHRVHTHKHAQTFSFAYMSRWELKATSSETLRSNNRPYCTAE